MHTDDIVEVFDKALIVIGAQGFTSRCLDAIKSKCVKFHLKELSKVHHVLDIATLSSSVVKEKHVYKIKVFKLYPFLLKEAGGHREATQSGAPLR